MWFIGGQPIGAPGHHDVFRTYSFKGDACVKILSNDNEISFISSPDYENPMDANVDNVYLLDLMAEDGAGNSTMLELSITVLDVAESAPEITSSSAIAVAENTEGVVYVATANETVIFTLGTSKDEAQFALTNGTEISFGTTPDFETPLDADKDNVYEVDLNATNGGGLSSTLEFTFTVRDMDEVAPSITSGLTASFEENGTGVAYSITADESATFSLGTSKDEALFLLENENEISFTTIPDFETPGDSDGDNVYLLDISAIDVAGNSTTIELSISVTDVNEDVLSTIIPVRSLKVYPNPATNILSFEADQAEKVTVADLTGRVMFIPAGEDEQLLDISDLAEGVYVLRIETANRIYHQRFTKR
ncbi:MAG: T9SS type A sorting domain-containing protein [Cytophagales bacterium]|nr:T9SS type A sorting domain-containing protein [Cytophagales bacterium]